MSKKKFSSIPSIIKDAKKGKMFILVDDENRENEGDLVIPGSKCNSKVINFMAKHGRGLICLALTKKQIDRLRLPLIGVGLINSKYSFLAELHHSLHGGFSIFGKDDKADANSCIPLGMPISG